jgi:hypothetical protein
VAIYNVVMGQALVTDLSANSVYTGVLRNNAKFGLQSCSAVVLINTATNRGGLYHYPSGALEGQPEAKKIMTDMITAITPNEAWIYYGTRFSADSHTGSTDVNWFLLGKIPQGPGGYARVRRRPVRSGSLQVGRPSAATVFSDREVDGGLIDLADLHAGVYSYGTLYGENQNLGG